MENLTNVLLTVLILMGMGFGFWAMIKFKLFNQRTSDIIYTADQVLVLIYAIVKAVTEDKVVVDKIYGVLSDLLAFAQVLAVEGVLDKQFLIDSALTQCDNLFIELSDRDLVIITSAVELIYMFVSE